MPYMMPGDVHVNKPLGTVMVAYGQQTTEFIADKVFPNIPVDKQTDFYYKMGRRSFLQTNMKKRAPRTETPGVDWNQTRDTFATEVWGLHHDIEDQFRASADENWNLDKSGTELITQQALLRREKEWISSFFGAGIWAANFTGVAAAPNASQFLQFDQSGSSPITVFKKARRDFHRRTGVKPNTVVFGPEVWDTLIDHPEFIERIKYTQAGFVTQQLVAKALQIDNVYVAEAVEATDDQDELTADVTPTTQYLAGKGFLLCYSNPRPSRDQPSAGYTFSWKGYLGASAFGGRIKKFRMEPIACDRIEIEMAYDFKAVAPELGAFYSAAIA
jgi:hypothetical protein